MAKYSYIKKGGQPGYYDAPDDDAAMASLSSFADRDPSSGAERVASGSAPVTPAPGAPARPEYSKIAKNAGAAGLSMSDYSSLIGPTPEEEKAAKDTIAKQFGYGNADEFFADAFRKPSRTTVDFYKSSFAAAGLDKILRNVNAKRESLNRALGVVNDNPWLDEASRSGKARRLQELAYADIQGLQNEYDLRLGHVRDLVSQHAADLGEDEKIRDARLKYLENAVKEATTAAGKNRALENLSEYLEGRRSTEETETPKTVNVPGTSNMYQYDSMTGEWKLIQKGRVPARGGSGGSGSGSGSDDKKIIAAFNKSVTNREALNRARTREQFIRELQTQYPQIEAQDIARKVYEIFPDGFDAPKMTPKPADPLDKYNE